MSRLAFERRPESIREARELSVAGRRIGLTVEAVAIGEWEDVCDGETVFVSFGRRGVELDLHRVTSRDRVWTARPIDDEPLPTRIRPTPTGRIVLRFYDEGDA